MATPRMQPAPRSLELELTSRGIRLTRQRHIILEVIENAGKHLDASQILRRAVKSDATINRVTVYRTLGLLKKLGLIDELDLLHVRGEGHYYEPRRDRDHIHVTCFKCKETHEMESVLWERLKGQVERDMDFRISITRVEIGGFCPKCRG